MALSLAFAGLIPERASQILQLILSDPLVYLPLLGIWFLFELFYLVSNSDSDVKESDLLENSISSIYVAIMISPIISSGGKITLAAFANPSARTFLSIILFIYASLMIFFAFTKILPHFMVYILGGASLDTTFTMLALIYVDGKIPIDFATVSVILIPVIIMHILKLFRKFGR